VNREEEIIKVRTVYKWSSKKIIKEEEKEKNTTGKIVVQSYPENERTPRNQKMIMKKVETISTIASSFTDFELSNKPNDISEASPFMVIFIISRDLS
jgi:hypothetical protein